MGKYILLSTLCITFIVLTAAQDNIHFGEPSCVNTVSEYTETWIYGSSTPYNLGYTCGLDTGHAVQNIDASVSLTIDGAGCPTSCSGFDYACGEVISSDHTKYGTYTCFMTAQKVSGTIQSCQIASTTRMPFEMIYVAFIGNVTEQVFIGFFVDGEFTVFLPKLNYDGSLQAHNYTIVWTPSMIQWYADTSLLQEVITTQQLPVWPDRFVQNFITDANDGVSGDWHGLHTDGIPVNRNFTMPLGGVSVEIYGRLYVPENDWACPGQGPTSFVSNTSLFFPYSTDCTMAETESIFIDALSKGWNMYTATLASVDAAIKDVRKLTTGETALVHSGYSTIVWDLYSTDKAALSLVNDTAFGIYDFYGFEFWFNPNQASYPLDFQACLVLEDGMTLSNCLNFSQFAPSDINDFTWNRFVIPVGIFDLSNASALTGIYLYNPFEYSGPAYVDDIYLIQAEPICANETLVVFDDTISKSFTNGSWGDVSHTFNFKSDNSYSGVAIQWQLTYNSGLKFIYAKGDIPSTYTAVSFWINAALTTSMEHVVVYMTTPGSTLAGNAAGAGPIFILDFYGGSLPASTSPWINVVIPFYEFGITSGTLIDSVVLNCQVGYGDYDGVLYVDLIELIAETQVVGKKANSATSLSSSLLLLCVSLLFSVMYML